MIARRRMVRSYTHDPVDAAALERIVAAGTRAPSAGFAQGVSLVVITDPARRAVVAEAADEARWTAGGREPWLSRAPAHIVICVSEAAYRERYAEADKATSDAVDAVPWWWVDAGAAMENLLLAAVDEGLGAGFLGAHAIDGLAGLLDLPADVTPVGVVTAGHPAAEQPLGSARRGRRPDLVHREAWGRHTGRDDR